VVLFNAGKYAEAKTQFDNATKADPNNANAFYQLGMTNLNLGQIPEAVSALETFLKLAPNDPKAAQVQQSLPALQQMLKK
jgi:Flp pilus assembly protein TadD